MADIRNFLVANSTARAAAAANAVQAATAASNAAAVVSAATAVTDSLPNIQAQSMRRSENVSSTSGSVIGSNDQGRSVAPRMSATTSAAAMSPFEPRVTSGGILLPPPPPVSLHGGHHNRWNTRIDSDLDNLEQPSASTLRNIQYLRNLPGHENLDPAVARAWDSLISR